ncbi:MAG TPA: relaxase/mobilization nuclease domain-containing protein, partial [Acidobacteriota bacterium]|nr:relaxase/mobilization nuclease domain-containing protein [Acidobacteriota bacterium]
MSSVCKVTCGKLAGGSGANARYITRESACDRWEARHLAPHEIMGATNLDRRHAAAQHMERLSSSERGNRRDYRVILSFEREVSSDKALAMAREFLDKSHFRNNPALLAVHRNTEHVHVHILLAARKLDGLKLDMNRRMYESFDKLWAKIYQREMGREQTRDQVADRHREAIGDREISLAEWRRRYGQL